MSGAAGEIRHRTARLPPCFIVPKILEPNQKGTRFHNFYHVISILGKIYQNVPQ